MGILERSLNNQLIGGAQFVQKFQTETYLLILVPLESPFDIEIRRRLGNQPVLVHLDFLLNRSSAS